MKISIIEPFFDFVESAFNAIIEGITSIANLISDITTAVGDVVIVKAQEVANTLREYISLFPTEIAVVLAGLLAITLVLAVVRWIT